MKRFFSNSKESSSNTTTGTITATTTSISSSNSTGYQRTTTSSYSSSISQHVRRNSTTSVPLPNLPLDRYRPEFHSFRSNCVFPRTNDIGSTQSFLSSEINSSNDSGRALPANRSVNWTSTGHAPVGLSSRIFGDARSFNSISPSLGSSSSSSVRSTNSSTIGKYDMPKNGYVLIFHNKKYKREEDIRRGSERDLQLLQEFFGNYRVKIKVYNDLGVKEVKDKMAKVQRKQFTKYSCLIVIIMSHGGTKNKIYTHDGCFDFEEDMVERTLMNATLKDKPKLFIVQACKGDAEMVYDARTTATNKNDIYKCYSTYEGTVSFRNEITGTYFIQTLFKLIEEFSDEDITDIMIRVRSRFTQERRGQAPTDTTTLQKKFYFKDLRK